MKKTILITAPFEFMPREDIIELEQYFHVDYRPTICLDDIGDSLELCHLWIPATTSNKKIDGSVISNSKNLEAILTPSTAWSHIDEEALMDSNVKLYSLRDCNQLESITASSEFTFFLLLALLRKMPIIQGQVLNYNWRLFDYEMRGYELKSKVVGVVGLGRIGMNVAKYANAFGAKVLYYDTKPKKTDVAEFMDLETVLQSADIIVLSITNKLENKRFFDLKRFELMKQDSWFINTSRGELVDEEALLENLRKKKLAGAALDVLTGETSPIHKPNPLIEYSRVNNNLIITPHVAGLTYDSERKAGQMIVNLAKSLA